jgi:hypothetical protein
LIVTVKDKDKEEEEVEEEEEEKKEEKNIFLPRKLNSSFTYLTTMTLHSMNNKLLNESTLQVGR